MTTPRRKAPRKSPQTPRRKKAARPAWLKPAGAALGLVVAVGALTLLVQEPRPAYTPVPPAPPLEREAAEVAPPRLPESAPAVPPAREVPEAPPAPESAPAPAAPEPPKRDAPKAEALPPAPPVPAGEPAWRRHAVPAPVTEGRPRIVLVIDDMGLDRKRSARISALPGPVTTAWLPYAKELPDQTAAARANGHELIVHVPMEPDGSGDPGPNALRAGLPAAEIKARLERNLSAFQGYVGINNHMGSRFTADRDGMAVVLAELAGRGLLFLDSRTTAQTKAPELAARYGLPPLSRDVFLDHQMTPQAVAAALAKTEEVARRNGIAIAIGHPHDVTADALEKWLPTLAAKGFALVPLSAAVRGSGPS
ncbi:MAG TPA: divergent polysaccharide deacetylase family protein [Azospirillaceae bacterium]|nr:divergent polysaccharide deacetylase family protein [Azospirillaceae bacterium]